MLCSWNSWILRKFRCIFRGLLVWQWGFHLKGKILPPNNEGDIDSDKDSEDENELLESNLNRSQFLAGAIADVSTSSDNISLYAGDKEEAAGPSVDKPSKRNK